MPSASSRSAGARVTSCADVVEARADELQRQVPQFGDRHPVARQLDADLRPAGTDPAAPRSSSPRPSPRRRDRRRSRRSARARPARRSWSRTSSSMSCGTRAAHARGEKGVAEPVEIVVPRPVRVARAGQVVDIQQRVAAVEPLQPAMKGGAATRSGVGSSGTGRRNRRARRCGSSASSTSAETETVPGQPDVDARAPRGAGVPRAAPRRPPPTGQARRRRSHRPTGPATATLDSVRRASPCRLRDRRQASPARGRRPPARPRAAHRAGRPASSPSAARRSAGCGVVGRGGPPTRPVRLPRPARRAISVEELAGSDGLGDRRRPPVAGHEQRPLRPGERDVEQPPLLVESLLARTRRACPASASAMSFWSPPGGSASAGNSAPSPRRLRRQLGRVAEPGAAAGDREDPVRQVRHRDDLPLQALGGVHRQHLNPARTPRAPRPAPGRPRVRRQRRGSRAARAARRRSPPRRARPGRRRPGAPDPRWSATAPRRPARSPIPSSAIRSGSGWCSRRPEPREFGGEPGDPAVTR